MRETVNREIHERILFKNPFAWFVWFAVECLGRGGTLPSLVVYSKSIS